MHNYFFLLLHQILLVISNTVAFVVFIEPGFSSVFCCNVRKRLEENIGTSADQATYIQKDAVSIRECIIQYSPKQKEFNILTATFDINTH